MESNTIPDYSLDSFIKNTSNNKSDISDKKKGISNIINDVNYSEIAKKYNFKEKKVKTILNKAKETRSIF